jgi:hypothetical protein
VWRVRDTQEAEGGQAWPSDASQTTERSTWIVALQGNGPTGKGATLEGF